MRILKNFQEILEIGKDCLEKRQKQKKPVISDGIKKYPPQIDGPWEQSPEALENTIKYVFDYLHHSCYMMCVVEGKPTMYKIVNRETIPSIKKTLKRKSISTKKTWRVLQCVLKEYSKQEVTSVDWGRFLNELQFPLPDGVYILNLTDAVVLRKDGKDPWNISLGTFQGTSKFLPILGGSSKVGYHDIPIPNYDDARIVLGYDKLPEVETNWENKKPIAVFRGASTGCGTTSETNMRIKLSNMKSESLDVGVVQVTNKMKFDPLKGLSLIKKSDVGMAGFLSMTEQSKYKYMIHVDGNVAAYRLLKTMLLKSVILKVEGEYLLWVDYLLKPWKHYVPVKADLSDLEEMVKWCQENDSKAKKIAEEGYKFAEKHLTKSYVMSTFAKILWKLY